MTSAPNSRRIVLATIGSLGDLHPILALALELRRRGHSVTVASTPWYRSRVESLGLAFRPLRPDWNPTDQALIAQCEDLRTGPEVLFRKIILPHISDTFHDLMAATADADLMVAGELVYAAPLVAEKRKLRWVSEILSPCSFFSAHDPSLLVNIPAAYRLRNAGPAINRALLNFGKLASRHWWTPVRNLRRQQGLRVSCDPVFRDKFSPELVLALFSSALALPQPDWPSHTLQPGFVFLDSPELPHPALAQFLASGDAPIVFALGSTAVHHPGNFYQESLRAATALGCRAILLGANSQAFPASPNLLTLPYAPNEQVFPHAAAIVHQGGSGTTAQALRSGRPQLFVPFGWDQPDNAARVERAGAAIALSRSTYNAQSAQAALHRLLTEPDFTQRALALVGTLAAESALQQSGDAIDQLLASAR